MVLQLGSLIDKLSEQLTLKGKALVAFKEKNNIMLTDEPKNSVTPGNLSKPSEGVLVT